MSLLTTEPKVLARFEHVWESMRRYQVRQGLCWTVLALVLGLALVTTADYRLELSWTSRALGLGATAVVSLAVLWTTVVVPVRWWTRPRTAAEIEARFPQLGQRIRTVVQYAGLPEELMHSEGVTPSLVGALAAETEVQAGPLPLDAIVPARRVRSAATLAALPALFLIGAALSSIEWRIALERALLGDRPYTTLQVLPGDFRVEEGGQLTIAVELQGRLKREVVFYSRTKGQAAATWKAAPLPAPERGPEARREVNFAKVKEPFEYCVVAGPARSPTYAIGVIYPLAIKSFEVTLQPPAYTAIEAGTVKGGDLQAVQGTGATFRIIFDEPPAEASLVLIDPSLRSKDKDAPPPRTIALKDEGTTFTANLKLIKSLAYRIEARSCDHRFLPKNRYRIDVREDRAPRVAFDEPDEALEVHPIAEVLHRIRVSDDFGLTRAGIVFRFNNGDEQSLVLKEFERKSGKPQVGGTLQELLLLEKLAATPTDSVTYYAFAEDNFPDAPHRAETDLRYIDIRPFKREYKLAEAGGSEGEDQFTSLAELIARQRYNLNRTVRLARHKPADKTPSDDPLKITSFEEALAGLTREVAEGLEGIVGERIEPLHAAEESMLAAVKELDRGRNDTAPNHMIDALRHLIEARQTLQVLIGPADSAMRQAMRQFDRSQAQKIRKPKDEKEEAEEIADRLEELAQEEDFVYATLAAGAAGDQPAKAEKGETGEKAETGEKPENTEKPEKKSSEAKAEGPQGDQGTDPGKGQRGQKGETGAQGTTPGKGRDGLKGDADGQEGTGPSQKNERRELTEKQEKIADELRALEEKLKKLEAASDLAKARMSKAAETAEKTSGALARGNSKEAADDAKSGAAQLHELARQVKGEISREVADELAMARDLADELADREAELGQKPDGNDSPGRGEKGDQPGKAGKGKGGRGDLTDAERLERLEEAAKTLEEWLQGAAKRAEGKAAEQVRDLIEQSAVTEVVERMERVGTLRLGGQKPEARREAEALSKTLEALARQLDVLHRGIVSPQLAALVEFDRRVAELTENLKALKTDADITAWHRLAADLVLDLEKAGLSPGADALSETMAGGGWRGGPGGWDWGTTAHATRLAPDSYRNALRKVTQQIQDKVQDMVLKDLASARDEATPPEFKELVERYYEVLSKDVGSK